LLAAFLDAFEQMRQGLLDTQLADRPDNLEAQRPVVVLEPLAERLRQFRVARADFAEDQGRGAAHVRRVFGLEQADDLFCRRILHERSREPGKPGAHRRNGATTFPSCYGGFATRSNPEEHRGGAEDLAGAGGRWWWPGFWPSRCAGVRSAWADAGRLSPRKEMERGEQQGGRAVELPGLPALHPAKSGRRGGTTPGSSVRQDFSRLTPVARNQPARSR